jgi:hypothetical protein
MASRVYSYRVEIDARSAAQSAAQVRAVFQRELNAINFAPKVGGSAGGNSLAGASGAAAARGSIGLGGALQGIAAFSLGGVTVAQIGQFAVAANQQATAYARVRVAAENLAGSQSRLNEMLSVYDQVTGGVVNKSQALQDVTRLMAVGFADSTQELEQFVRAARGISIATGQSQDYVIGQLQLAIANQSTMRLDQLGLGVSEVKNRIDQLRRANKDLTTEQAYQQAVLGLAGEKFGELVDSAQSAATNIEKVTKAWADLKLEVGSGRVGGVVDAQAGATAGAVDFLANIVAVINGKTPENQTPNMERILGDRGQLTSLLQGRRDAFGGSDQEMQRMAALLQMSKIALDGNVQGAAALDSRIVALAQSMALSAGSTREQTTELDKLENLFELNISGGIRYAEVVDAAAAAADRLAASQAIVNATFERAQQLYNTNIAGQMYFNPGPGLPSQPVTPYGPNLPSDDYMRWQGIRTGGGFLTPGGTSVGDIRSRWGEQYASDQEQKTLQSQREAEAAGLRAAREAESAWERAAKNTEQAFRDAASAFVSKLESVPGLFGASEVTQEQMTLAGYGVPQNFADDYLRRLTDEVQNGVQYEGVDIRDAASRIGVSGDMDPKAILAMFSEAWNNQSLFANPANLDLINKDAVAASLAQQRAGEQGRANILGMFGVAEDSGGAYFTGIGADMQSGLLAGAEGPLGDFGLQAVEIIAGNMQGDAAAAKWNSVGLGIAGMLAGTLQESIDSIDIVTMITGAVMAQLSAQLESAP